MFNYRVISIGDKSDFSNVTMPGVRIPGSPLHIPSSPWHQQQATLGKCTHIDKHQSSHRWEQKGIQFSHFPLFSRRVQFGVLCLQIFLSSPLIRRSVQLPWCFCSCTKCKYTCALDWGCRKESSPHSSPGSTSSPLHLRRCWFFLHSGRSFTFWSELHPRPTPFSHFADSGLPWLQMPARAHYFDSHNWLDFFTNYISNVWE